MILPYCKITTKYKLFLLLTVVIKLYFAYGNNDVCQSDNTDECQQNEHFVMQLKPNPEKGGEEVITINGQNYILKTLSIKPSLFEIEDFLTTDECEHFIKTAKIKGLQDSITYKHGGKKDNKIYLRDVNQDKRLSINEMMLTLEDGFDMYFTEEDILEMYKNLKMDKNGDRYINPEELNTIDQLQFQSYLEEYAVKYPTKRSRFSKQIWLFADTETDSVFEAVQERVQKLTKLYPTFIKKSDFQVVNYGLQGHYNAHHDSGPLHKDVPCCTRKRTKSCRICRFMTILFYLNDVIEGGETAFPLAGNDTYDEKKFMEQHQQNLMQHCDKSNLKVAPKKGKAVVWYNHNIDPETQWIGELDPYTWHGGCPVIKGEKWIANFWIKYTDDKKETLQL